MEAAEEHDEQLTHFEFEQEETKLKKTREMCSNGCDRPANVCLCGVLPTQPILTSTKIVILHHPHELRHKLATVPILTKCLINCQTIIGRRLRFGSSTLLDSLHNASINDSTRPYHAVFLFPGTASSPSVELNQWASSNMGRININSLVLIVFDGTWKHAKEMVGASYTFLSKFASQVCLDYDAGVDGESIYNSELVLRKEPFGGCMSTIEAVARSLRVLEKPNGIEIENALISVLRTMVQFQACHLKTVKPRPKLSKKGKEAIKSLKLSDE
ncbi:Dtw domain-containing protein [Thalictrum thalictroides]|uniref:tRNA-uridine aminocarboxypropyltransferase n=1 Tax=Thalictrum thalictroides TaxID=46969 RepID=A0A7J6WME5_THATH|nr:Dtw domain-containing protein [Thalictrum thalictroides]